MNVKIIFIGLGVIGVLPTLAGLGGVREEHAIRSESRNERRALEREAMDSLRESQLGLKWARRCTPVLDHTTRKEFPLAPGMRFVSDDTGQQIGGDRIVCNSTGDVAEVINGYVSKVITIESEHREEYARIFNTLQTSQVGTQPRYDNQHNTESEYQGEPVVEPPPNPFN